MLERIISSHSMILGGPEPHLLTPLAHLGYYARVDAAPYDPAATAEGLMSFVSRLDGGRDAYRNACRAYCEVLYGRYLSQSGKTLCLDKTPAYALILPFLAEVFPDAHYVVLTRHPLAIFASYANSFFSGDYAAALSYNPILNRYVPSIAAFLRQTATPLVHVRYESLVQHPEDEMQRVFEHLGVPYEADAIDYGAHGSPRERKGLGDPIGVDRHQRPTTGSVSKWVEDLAGNPEREAMMREVIGQIDAEDLRTFGYPIESLWEKLERHRSTCAAKKPAGAGRYGWQRKAIVGFRRMAQRHHGIRRMLMAGRSACDALLKE